VEVRVATEFPFENGRFEGRGKWIDQSAEGEYTVAIAIADGADSTRVHTTRRVFLKLDGSTLYEEETTVTYTPGDRSTFKVAITFAAGTVRGKGYTMDNQCHFEVPISPTLSLDATFTFSPGKIQGLGSSSNKGNLTAWREELTKKEA
jgi:hypothetical protein